MDFKNNVFSFFGHRNNGADTANLPEPGDERKLRNGRITDPQGGWEPAGITEDGDLIIQSLVTGRYATLRSQDLNERKLMLLLGREACERYTVTDPKTKKRKFDLDGLLKEMVACCQDMGLFDWSRVRGPGLYRDGDTLIINDGERVVTADGRRIIAAPDYEGPCYQAGPSLGYTLETPCASEAEVQRVVQAIDSFGLRTEGDRIKILGWMSAVSLSRALPAQWLLMLTADRGSGKSSLVELLQQMLGRQAFRRDGVPSKAQVIHASKDMVATLLADEVEARGDAKRAVKDLMELLRSGTQSSSVKSVSRILGNREQLFNAPAGALLAGISLPALDEATEGRAVKVCLDRLPEASRERYQPLLDVARQEETAKLGARVRRLLLSRWDVMRGTQATAMTMLTALKHESRDAAKFATIIAGYVTLTQDTAATAQQVERLIEALGVRQPETVAVQRDGQACLDRLLRRKVAVFAAHGHERSKQHASVYDILKEVLHGPQDERRHLIRQMEEFGIRVLWSKAKGEFEPSWKLAICSSNDHEGMRRLMMQTNWALGGWKDVLLRLPGAAADVQRVAGRAERVVVVPMPSELLEPPAPEVYDLPTDASEQKPARGEYIE